MKVSYILVFFLITASLGIALLTLVMKDKKRPMLLAAAHGLFAASSFGLLTYYTGLSYLIGGNRTTATITWILFTIAMMGGLYIFINDKVLKKDIAKWIPFIHAGAAVAGIIALIGFML
jgi:ABC-type Na+ efflux pump permease subunit